MHSFTRQADNNGAYPILQQAPLREKLQQEAVTGILDLR